MARDLAAPTSFDVGQRRALQDLSRRISELENPRWQTLALSAPFVNYDTVNWQPAQYAVVGKRVMLRGLIKATGATAATQTIWVVPADLAPVPLPSNVSTQASEMFAVWANTNGAEGPARVEVSNVSGWKVSLRTAMTSVAYLSLSGVSWSIK